MLDKWVKLALFKESGVKDGCTNDVGVHIACGSSVFNLALLGISCRRGDSD